MILKTSVATVLTVLLVSGCSSPYGSRPDQHGAVLGGLTGGAAAEASSGERRTAAFGSLLGRATGGLLGNTLKAQERELRVALGSAASVVNTGSELVVTLPESVTFDAGSAELRPAYRPAVATLSRSLQDYPDTTVIVSGHTDSAETNPRLSEDRAGAVGRLLVETGTSPARIRIQGRGAAEPVASNEIPAGRAANRRVVVTIRPGS